MKETLIQQKKKQKVLGHLEKIVQSQGEAAHQTLCDDHLKYLGVWISDNLMACRLCSLLQGLQTILGSILRASSLYCSSKAISSLYKA